MKYLEKPCCSSPHKLKEIKTLQMKKATKKIKSNTDSCTHKNKQHKKDINKTTYTIRK
jgi:hypothetical protein